MDLLRPDGNFLKKMTDNLKGIGFFLKEMPHLLKEIRNLLKETRNFLKEIRNLLRKFRIFLRKFIKSLRFFYDSFGDRPVHFSIQIKSGSVFSGLQSLPALYCYLNSGLSAGSLDRCRRAQVSAEP